MGFGGGSVLIIFLTEFMNMNQKQAQGINLFFFIPCALYSIRVYKKQNLIIKDIIKPFVLCGLFGVVIGYLIITFIPSYFLRKLFGLFLIVMGVKEIFPKK